MSNTIYCTYLTVYSGDKLPPLYIGSTSVDKIIKGYRGSVLSKKYKQIWKSELKENPHLFQTKILTTHETREDAFEEEIRYQIEHNVVKSSEYVNMALANKKLIFCDHNDSEYRKKLSNTQKKLWNSEEYKKKQSESLKDGWTEESKKKVSEKHKGKIISEEQKKKQSESLRGRKQSEEHKRKRAEARKGKKMSEQARKNMSEAQKTRFKSNKYHPLKLESA